MQRPEFLDSRRPAYQVIFSITLILFFCMIAIGAIQAWRLFSAPPSIQINPILLANRLMEEKKFDEALREYERTVIVEPGNFEAWSRIGTIQGQKGNHELELQNYRQALKIRSRNPQLLANAGNACFKLKRYGDAAAYYRHAAQYAPENAEYQNSLGGALAMGGDAAAAVACFERAIELQPDNAQAKRNLELARRDASKTAKQPAAPPI